MRIVWRRNRTMLAAAAAALVACGGAHAFLAPASRPIAAPLTTGAAGAARTIPSQRRRSTTTFLQSSEIRDDPRDEERTAAVDVVKKNNKDATDRNSGDGDENQMVRPNFLESLLNSIQEYDRLWQRRPPMKVEDMNLLFYDIILILNLSVSISFWVVHRMDFAFIGTAFNEGCLMSLLWIGAGLYSGAFLNSAVDGHFGSDSEQGGPKAAAILAFQAFVNACSLRLLFSLAVAVLEHRPVGIAMGEQIMPLEIGFGLVMMSTWRMLHSSYISRM